MTTSKNSSHHFGFMTRRHLLGTLILCGMMGNAYAGSCSGALGNYTCSGVEDTANDIEQILTGNSLSVMTLPGFGISTNSGNAFSLAADNELVFTDNNGATITGNVDGIYAVNIASGAILSITTTGTVTGSQGLGIFGSTLGTDLTIDTADVSGNTYGIYAENYGTGSISITATGSVTGAVIDGIVAVNATGTDITIDAVNVSGQPSGIIALNYGTGATSISTTGTVTGKDSVGLYVGTLGTGLTLDTVNVLGGSTGIHAENSGSGAMSITTTGTVTGALAAGIHAYNAGTDQSIRAADVTGYTSAIYAENSGSGAQSITTTGTVTSMTGYGIEAHNSTESASLIVLGGSTVQGYAGGIFVDSASVTAPVDITNAGTVRNVSRLSSDLAILVTGASGIITNNGLLLGTVQLSDEGNIFRNNVDGIWNTAGGTNDLGALIASNAVFNNGSIVAANGSVADPLQVTTFNNVGTF
ncbi:hypothetical protein LH416_22940, partial [Yersinia massiliensis]|nr:hypothetical protein [Yersinia massiliensis]